MLTRLQESEAPAAVVRRTEELLGRSVDYLCSGPRSLDVLPVR